MTTKKFTVSKITEGFHVSPETGFVPRFMMSDGTNHWVLEEFTDGRRRAVVIEDPTSVTSREFHTYNSELSRDAITFELEQLEKLPVHPQFRLHENTESMASAFEEAAQNFKMPRMVFDTTKLEELVRNYLAKDGAVGDTAWWFTFLAKEGKDRLAPKARLFAKLSKAYTRLAVVKAKEQAKEFNEEHPEAVSCAFMGGSILLTIGYFWWAKWYSDRWMEKLAKTIKEAS